MRTVKEIKSDINKLKVELKAVSKERMLQAALTTLRDEGYVYDGSSWNRKVESDDSEVPPKPLPKVKQYVLYQDKVWFVHQNAQDGYLGLLEITACYFDVFTVNSAVTNWVNTHSKSIKWVGQNFVVNFMRGKGRYNSGQPRINW